MSMTVEVLGVSVELAAPGVALGVVVGGECGVARPDSALDAALTDAIAAAEASANEQIKADVRNLLRFGKYKPTGRGKPACEYLQKAAREARFPRINNLVDINNLISLKTQLPISLVDVGRAETSAFRVRRGKSDEAYVFNSSDQIIGLEDLLLVARLPDDVPCANPVKDSMATKLDDASTFVMAVLYAPPNLVERLEQATVDFSEALGRWGGATRVASATIVSA